MTYQSLLMETSFRPTRSSISHGFTVADPGVSSKSSQQLGGWFQVALSCCCVPSGWSVIFFTALRLALVDNFSVGEAYMRNKAAPFELVERQPHFVGRIGIALAGKPPVQDAVEGVGSVWVRADIAAYCKRDLAESVIVCIVFAIAHSKAFRQHSGRYGSYAMYMPLPSSAKLLIRNCRQRADSVWWVERIPVLIAEGGISHSGYGSSLPLWVNFHPAPRRRHRVFRAGRSARHESEA